MLPLLQEQEQQQQENQVESRCLLLPLDFREFFILSLYVLLFFLSLCKVVILSELHACVDPRWRAS